MKIINYIQQNYLAFWISLIYVALGGVVACSLYPEDPLHGSWFKWGFLFTLPVNIIGFAHRLAIGKEYYPVVIIQVIIFVPTFILVAKLIAKKRNKNKNSTIK